MLRRYFEAHGVLHNFDWRTVTVRNVDNLLEVFLQLDDGMRGEMVEDFANIKLLATPVGKVQIIDEAHFHGVPDEVARHDGNMVKRPYSPAFEIIFIHNDAERTLSIWHQGHKDRVKDLQQAFAKAVLKQDIAWDSPRDDRVYDLDCFLESFSFRPAPGSESRLRWT